MLSHLILHVLLFRSHHTTEGGDELSERVILFEGLKVIAEEVVSAP